MEKKTSLIIEKTKNFPIITDYVNIIHIYDPADTSYSKITFEDKWAQFEIVIFEFRNLQPRWFIERRKNNEVVRGMPLFYIERVIDQLIYEIHAKRPKIYMEWQLFGKKDNI